VKNKRKTTKPKNDSNVFSYFLQKKIILIIVLILCLSVAFVLLKPIVLRLIYSSKIPDLPDLSGYPPPAREYIKQNYSAALQKPYSDDIVGKLAMVYHANLFYNEAETCYQLAENLNHNEWLWPYYTALIKEEYGDIQSTIECLNTVVKINPDIPYAWFRLGNAYLKQNSIEAAESAFKNVIRSQHFNYRENLPDNEAFSLKAYAGLNLGRVYLDQEKYEQAKVQLEQLIQEYPDFSAAYRLLGQLFKTLGNDSLGNDYTIRAGDFESYIPPSDPIFNQLILNSRRSDFIFKYIDIALKGNNFEWAEYLCRYILQYNPNDIAATEKYINVLLLKYKNEELDKELDRFYDFYFDNAEKLTSMSETLYLRNQYQYALKYINQALAIDPTAIDAHILYLKILVSLRKDAEAIQHCKKILKTEPKNSGLRTEYGRILALRGRKIEARKQLNFALQLDPDNEIALIYLGIMSQDRGDINSALHYYRQSIQVNPLNVNTILKLGNFLLDLRKWNEALQLFQKSLKDSPNSLELLERYAWILATCPDPRIRNGKEALALAKRISFMRKTTRSQDIQCNMTLAAAYAENGDFTKAIALSKDIINRAKALQLNNYVSETQKMIELFEAKIPYRL
jgi:tetratricopeptide (TPR) repeat protein